MSWTIYGLNHFDIHGSVFVGILAQGTGVLQVFDESQVDETYQSSLETIDHMGKVVDSLYNKAKQLS